MNSCLNFIGTTSPLQDIGLVLTACLTWDLLVWLFVAVPWPAPLTIVAFWKCFGSVPTAQRMRARFCTAHVPAPELLSAMSAFKLMCWALSPARRSERPAGWRVE